MIKTVGGQNEPQRIQDEETAAQEEDIVPGLRQHLQ